MGFGILKYKHKITFESCPSPGKEILVQDANVALLVDSAIHHHQLRFAWFKESTSYHEGGANISICFLDAAVHQSFRNTLMNLGMTITVVKSEPVLISKYHMRPVLMVLVPVHACLYAVSAAMITSQSGASGWTSWAIASYYQISFVRAGRNMTSSSPDRLYPYSQWWEEPVSPHDLDEGTVFPWCGHPQPMPMRPLDSISSLTNRTEDFGDVTLWHSCVPWYRLLRPHTTRQQNNEFKISMWNIGWHDHHFVLNAIYGQRQHTAGCIRYKCDMLFGATREICTLREQTDWGSTESAVDCEIL